MVDLFVPDNYTRFYVLSNTLEATPPALSVKPKLQRALVRVGLGSHSPTRSEESAGQDIEPDGPVSYSRGRPLHLILSTLLTTFGVPVIRIDRRPSLDSVPFEDVYFVELEELGSPRETPVQPETDHAWLKRVRAGVARVVAAGGHATVLGIW